MDTIKEKTSYFVTVTFNDEAGNAIIPTAAWYSLWCETSDTVILQETAITGLASSKEIVVTALQNKIQANNNDREVKVLTIRFTYSGGQYQGTETYRWEVKNLKMIT